MKLYCLTVASACSVMADPSATTFEALQKKYQRKYVSPADERRARLNFEENRRTLTVHQRENPHATFALNQDFDRSLIEVRRGRSGKNQELYAAALQDPVLNGRREESFWTSSSDSSRKRKVDWRKEGVVTPVVQQGSCASCWAFVAAANLASQWAIGGNGPLTPLSEQELLSCDKNTGNEGCTGGLMTDAYEWYINSERGNAVTAESYPYASGGDGQVPKCNWRGVKMGANIVNYTILAKNEDAIAAHVASHGPVGVAINDYLLSMYRNGTLTGCDNATSGINHAVMIVGYNDEASPPYWIIKNSWGMNFGIDGYFYLAKGSNQCGIKELASAPIVAPGVSTFAPTAMPPPPTPAPPVTPHWIQAECTSSHGLHQHQLPSGAKMSIQPDFWKFHVVNVQRDFCDHHDLHV